MSVRWQFIEHSEHRNVRWTWRIVRGDGTIENHSASFSNYGAAVGDAIRHGFRPREQHWIVVTPHTVSHFRPGNPPMTLSVRDDAAASRAGWLQKRRKNKSLLEMITRMRSKTIEE